MAHSRAHLQLFITQTAELSQPRILGMPGLQLLSRENSFSQGFLPNLQNRNARLAEIKPPQMNNN